MEISKISKHFLTATFGVPCTWEEYAEGSIERVKLFAIEGVVLCADGERIPTGFALKIPLGQDGGAALITQGLAASLRGVQQGLQAQDLLRAVGLSGSLAGLGFLCGVYEECKTCYCRFRILQRCESSNSAGAPAGQLSSGRRR